jgi:hypothetical protein
MYVVIHMHAIIDPTYVWDLRQWQSPVFLSTWWLCSNREIILHIPGKSVIFALNTWGQGETLVQWSAVFQRSPLRYFASLLLAIFPIYHFCCSSSHFLFFRGDLNFPGFPSSPSRWIHRIGWVNLCQTRPAASSTQGGGDLADGDWCGNVCFIGRIWK